eukprot:jgi/Mesen1/6319/ME000326S05458
MEGGRPLYNGLINGHGPGMPLGPFVPIVITPEERAARAAIEKAEAEKRLQQAEQHLRSAIEVLHKTQREAGGGLQHFFHAKHPLCQHGDSCVANAIGSLCQSFLLAYGVRVGIGVLLRAFKLVRQRPVHSVLDFQLLLSEKNLIVREEACRNGLLFGGFTGLYHGMRCLLRRLRGRETPLNSFLAGSVAGLSVLALDDAGKRRMFALYLLARVAQCAFNSAESEGKLAVLGGHERKHVDMLMFCAATAQIMYAYVMRPESLPESYWDFIVRTGPMPKPVLQAVRESCRGKIVDSTSLAAAMRQRTRAPLGIGPHPSIIPCSILHPQSSSCVRHNGVAMRDTFQKTFPLYMSLTLVPFVFMQAPLKTAANATKSAVRSTAFISAFVGIYQGVVCLQRKVAERDHKLTYWLAGALAGLSALLEKPGRRSELALYTLPRAVDSLWYILINKHLLPDIKYTEVGLFCACMGGLMYYHDNEPDTVAPFVRGIITRFLSRTGFPLADPAIAGGGSLISPSSYSNLWALNRPSEVWPSNTDMDAFLRESEGLAPETKAAAAAAAASKKKAKLPAAREDKAKEEKSPPPELAFQGL